MPRAQYLNIRTLTHELIVNLIWKQFKDAIARNKANNSVKKAERKQFSENLGGNKSGPSRQSKSTKMSQVKT